MKKLIYVALFSTLLFSCGDKTKQKKATTTQKTETVKTVETETVSNIYSDTRFLGVKSGIVEYKITGSGNVMGQKMSINGTTTYIFKNWGVMDKEERKITENYNGEKRPATRELIISKDGIEYEVDDVMHRIMKTKDSRLIMLRRANSNDFEEATKKFMFDMGGRKTGSEKIKGYRCDIWEFMGSKTWVHKGIPLKTESKIMGIMRTEEAVKIRFNVSVSDTEFELPKDFRMVKGSDIDDFPDAAEIKDGLEDFQNLKNMSFEEWKEKMADGEELNGANEEQLRRAYNAMKEMMNGR